MLAIIGLGVARQNKTDKKKNSWSPENLPKQ